MLFAAPFTPFSAGNSFTASLFAPCQPGFGGAANFFGMQQYAAPTIAYQSPFAGMAPFNTAMWGFPNPQQFGYAGLFRQQPQPVQPAGPNPVASANRALELYTRGPQPYALPFHGSQAYPGFAPTFARQQQQQQQQNAFVPSQMAVAPISPQDLQQQQLQHYQPPPVRLGSAPSRLQQPLQQQHPLPHHYPLRQWSEANTRQQASGRPPPKRPPIQAAAPVAPVATPPTPQPEQTANPTATFDPPEHDEFQSYLYEPEPEPQHAPSPSAYTTHVPSGTIGGARPRVQSQFPRATVPEGIQKFTVLFRRQFRSELKRQLYAASPAELLSKIHAVASPSLLAPVGQVLFVDEQGHAQELTADAESWDALLRTLHRTVYVSPAEDRKRRPMKRRSGSGRNEGFAGADVITPAKETPHRQVPPSEEKREERDEFGKWVPDYEDPEDIDFNSDNRFF
eukprot:TRINITY_DN762_c1_g1_i1.p1 TRINITY_DN762_c1_g1~~TRINITY_DN762_c1_g1_i1.p1  ORF type:complete len:452 (+),score=72.55 TRINITY_DN762_c1_g1_i1:51-1406(+)